MSPEELKERVIAIGRVSVLATETQEYKRRGGLVGFDLCENLHTPEDFHRMLTERHLGELHLFDVIREEHRPIEEYWEYRYATLQVQHVYERLKVVWGFPMLSSFAVFHVAEIMAQWQRELCN